MRSRVVPDWCYVCHTARPDFVVDLHRGSWIREGRSRGPFFELTGSHIPDVNLPLYGISIYPCSESFPQLRLSILRPRSLMARSIPMGRNTCSEAERSAQCLHEAF